MKRLALATMLLLIIAGTAIWFLYGTAEMSRAVVEKIDPNARIKAALKMAQTGDAPSQYKLGLMYEEGDGADKSPTEAAKWYKLAAEQGHIKSQFRMGKLFASGSGVRQNFFTAAKWYRLAAAFGKHREAQYRLGELYFSGRGVEHDYTKAIEFYRQAGAQGHPVAQFILGAMYEEGWGVQQDLIVAYMWYSLALPKAEAAMAENKQYDPARGLTKLKTKMNRYQTEEAEKRLRALKAR